MALEGEGGEILMSHPRIVLVEWGCVTDQRSRAVGSNARLGASGDVVRVPRVCVRADDGSVGVGSGYPSPPLVGPTRKKAVPARGSRCPVARGEAVAWRMGAVSALFVLGQATREAAVSTPPSVGNAPHQGMVGYRHRSNRARRSDSC